MPGHVHIPLLPEIHHRIESGILADDNELLPAVLCDLIPQPAHQLKIQAFLPPVLIGMYVFRIRLRSSS